MALSAIGLLTHVGRVRARLQRPAAGRGQTRPGGHCEPQDQDQYNQAKARQKDSQEKQKTLTPNPIGVRPVLRRVCARW